MAHAEQTVTKLAVGELRDDLAEAIHRVTAKKERIVLCRKGKRLAALVPVSDLELIEDMEDIRAAEEALSEGGPTIPLEQVRKELGLK